MEQSLDEVKTYFKPAQMTEIHERTKRKFHRFERIQISDILIEFEFGFD